METLVLSLTLLAVCAGCTLFAGLIYFWWIPRQQWSHSENPKNEGQVIGTTTKDGIRTPTPFKQPRSASKPTLAYAADTAALEQLEGGSENEEEDDDDDDDHARDDNANGIFGLPDVQKGEASATLKTVKESNGKTTFSSSFAKSSSSSSSSLPPGVRMMTAARTSRTRAQHPLTISSWMETQSESDEEEDDDDGECDAFDELNLPSVDSSHMFDETSWNFTDNEVDDDEEKKAHRLLCNNSSSSSSGGKKKSSSAESDNPTGGSDSNEEDEDEEDFFVVLATHGDGTVVMDDIELGRSLRKSDSPNSPAFTDTTKKTRRNRRFIDI